MNRRELSFLLVSALMALAACGGTEVPPPRRLATTGDSVVTADPESAVRQTVSRFGARMHSAALPAPDTLAASRLQEAYGALVTPDLLSDWMSRPASAPGRHDRALPDHIEVRTLQLAGAEEYLVTGALIYQPTAASPGARRTAAPVRLRVRRGGDGSWRISVYEEMVKADGAS